MPVLARAVWAVARRWEWRISLVAVRRASARAGKGVVPVWQSVGGLVGRLVVV